MIVFCLVCVCWFVGVCYWNCFVDCLGLFSFGFLRMGLVRGYGFVLLVLFVICRLGLGFMMWVVD